MFKARGTTIINVHVEKRNHRKIHCAYSKRNHNNRYTCRKEESQEIFIVFIARGITTCTFMIVIPLAISTMNFSAIPLFYMYIYYCDSSCFKHNEFSCDSSCYKHNEFFLRFRFLTCTSIIVIPLALNTMNFPVIPLAIYTMNFSCDSAFLHVHLLL